MGDGNEEYSLNIEDAFKKVKRVNVNNNSEMLIASTSCKIVNWDNLIIIDKFISKKIPGFSESMCIVVKKNVVK